MNEQLFRDFVATAERYNYDWATVFSKFPELNNYDQQLLKDYTATAQQYNYDWNTVNSKFPEFNLGQQQPEAPKKKDGGFFINPIEQAQQAVEEIQQESVSPSDQSSSVSPSPSFYSQLPQAGMEQGPPMRPAEQMDQPVKQQGFVWDQPKTTLTASMQPVSKYEAEQKRLQEDKRLKKEAAENLLNWRETQALKIQEEEKLKEEEARLKAEALGISKTPEFVSKLNKIDNTLFYDEEKIKNLNDEFKDYGIVINKGGIFNNKLIARTEDGRASIEIDLTPDSEAQMVEESNKLRKFLNENNRVSQDEDFLSKALRAKNMRPVARINDDGTMSTVKFVSFDNKVIPTLFPLIPGSKSTSKDAWIELPFEQALKVAKERGEVFTFKTPEEAQEFASGSWKDISQVDIEGDNFYKQRGRDYITEKRRWERYDELDDLINFFEGYDTKNEEEIKAENPNLFVNGKPRYDIKEIVAGFKKEREQLRPLVKDITFFNQEGTSEKMRMDFDAYLAKRENEVASEATKTFREAQSDLSIINTESLKLFGVNINELAKNDKYKTQDPQAYNNLIQKYTDVTQLAQTAGMKYADAKTYYDAKINKEINSDLTDNIEATTNAISDGLKNGLIGDQLLALTIPGYDAWSGFKDKESAAKYISDKLSQMSQTQSRVMTRYAQSKTARDWWDVFLDDPFESMSLMASQSISQMLPYGVKIIPAIAGYSALTGAAYGGATTGGAGVLPGFIGGGIFGLRAGQSVAGYATEYTTSIMEAVKNNGYDPLNPQSLEQALNDQKVWDEGARTGAARGIPIAIVDYLTAGLAGKMIKPASKLASATSKMSRAAAENILIDPTAEATGELIAQGTEIALGTGRQALDWNEIGMEGIGGMGSNIPNYALNTYLATKKNTDINLAYNLTDIKKLAAENVSDERISKWANNMEQLGNIDASVNQRIQENIGLRRDAKEVLSIGDGGRASSNVVARTMELLAAKKELTATKNRQEVYSTEIKSINEELATIGKTKKLAPVEQQTNLKGIIEAIPEAQREAVGEYMINNIRYTKEQFLDKINSFTPARLLRSKIAVKGNPEVSQTFQQKVNAVQKQTTGEVPVQPEARVGEEVVQGEPQAGPEITTQEGITEEKVTPKQATVDIFTSAPTETKAQITFTSPDGNEMTLEGNEQVAAQLYDEAVAVPVEQRTPEQTDIVQKMEPIVAAATPTTEVTPTTEAKVEFTEQDRTRQQELTDALAKADKRRKNITVGETTIPKADVKAELDALNQKEQASQQPAPTTEVTLAERTPEQEADLLEELMSGKKKQPTTKEKGKEKKEATAKEKTAKRIRDKKIRGAMSAIDFGITQTLYNGALEFMARQVEKGTKLGNAIANTMKWIDDRMDGKKWNKGAFGKYMNDTYKVTLGDGREVEVLRDDSKETAEVINGWYQPIEQKILDTKEDKLPANKWAERLRSKEDEDLWTGVREYLEGKGNQSVSKKELLDFMRDNRVEIGKVVESSYEKYQLPGDKSDYKVILVTMPRKFQYPEEDYTIKSREEYIKDKSNYTIKEIPEKPGWNKGWWIEGKRGEGKFIESDYFIKTAENALDIYIEEFLDLGYGDTWDFYNKNGEYFNTITANSKEEAIEKYKEENKKEVGGFKSSHFGNQANVLVHLRMNTRTDADGNKVLFLEEVQSDWGQEGKKEGFETPSDRKKYEEFEKDREDYNRLLEEVKEEGNKLNQDKEFKNIVELFKSSGYFIGTNFKGDGKSYVYKETERSGRDQDELKENEIPSEIKKAFDLRNKKTEKLNKIKNQINLYEEKYGTKYDPYDNITYLKSPDVTISDIPAAPFVMDTNSWVKLGLKVALREAVAQGADKIAWTTGEQQNERYDLRKQVDEINYSKNNDGTYLVYGKKGGDIIFKDKSISENSLESSFGKDVAERIINDKGESKEGLSTKVLKGDNLSVGGKGMKGFYGSSQEGTKGIVGGVAEKLFGQKVGEVKIEGNTQQSIDVTPELKAEVEKGLPMFENLKLSDMVRNLQIKTKGLQSNVLGVPIAIWNAGVLTAAKAIDAGVAIKDAIKKGLKNIKDNYDGKFNETLAEKKMLITMYSEPIKMAREAGIGNDGIKVYLERKGLSEDQIDTLLKYKERAEKKAPTAEKVVGKPKPKKVTVNEMSALKDQIRLEAKAAREAKGDLNTKRKQLAAAINAMAKSGVISVRQAEIIIRRVNTVNLDNPDMVERLLDYADKVFKDADYADKLKTANKFKSNIKTLSKNEDKNGDLRFLGTQFIQIDPSMVEDINSYIDMASKIQESIKGSTLTATGLKQADIVNISEAYDYINEALKNQEKVIKEITANRIERLLSVDVSDLTYNQMLELIDLIKREEFVTEEDKETLSKKIDDLFNLNKEKEKSVRDTIENMFSTYSSIIDSMFRTGKDPFVVYDESLPYEKLQFKKSDIKLVREFMNMDLNKLSAKEALLAVDALNNFITNRSTANMATVVGKYRAKVNSEKLVKENIKSKVLRLFFSKGLGRLATEQLVSLPMVFERLFKSPEIGLRVMEDMGLTDVMNGASKAITDTSNIVNEYMKVFSNKKPNKKAFNDVYNIIERGMVAHMSRSKVGDAKQIQEEFNDRKREIEESIKVLSKGTDNEQKKAEIYKEVYNKILKDSKNSDEVKSKADKINIQAVNWMTKEWNKHYSDLADVSLSVYNTMLDKDKNYTPDRYQLLESGKQKPIDENASSFNYANGNISEKKSGTLMKTRDKKSGLPKDENGKVNRYVDLSFDSVNASALYSAFTDINTAQGIKQVKAFMGSDAFEEIIPNANDRNILEDRIKLAIRNIKQQNQFYNSELDKLARALDEITRFSASMALAGPTQVPKQTFSVGLNTLVNTGQLPSLDILYDKDKMDFINKSGRAIANRGPGSQIYLDSVNRMMEEAARSKPEAALKLLKKANDLWLKWTLANPDAFIAKASWLAYYEKSLKDQGLYKENVKPIVPSNLMTGATVFDGSSGIDYSTHELNEKAANYAQMMVDRNQNITDSRLAGSIYAGDMDAYKKFFIRTLLPLASFRLNQWQRNASDFIILTSETSSLQDKAKAFKSLSAFGVEQAMYRGIAVGFGIVFWKLADLILTGGEEDDEEEWKKRINNMIKGQATGLVTDVISPFPIADPYVKPLFNYGLSLGQDLMKIEEKDKLSIYTEDMNEDSFAKSLGMYGIALDKALSIYEDINMSITGEFKDNFDNTKYVDEDSKNILKKSIAPSILFNLGLIPGAPEFNNIMGKVKRQIKKSGETKKQIEKNKAYAGYDTLEEFEKLDPEKYNEYSKEGGALYEYKQKNKESEETEEEKAQKYIKKYGPEKAAILLEKSKGGKTRGIPRVSSNKKTQRGIPRNS